MTTSNVAAGPSVPVSEAEREAKRAAARKAIREALWEGTNALGRVDWQEFVLGVVSEIESDWD